MKYGARVIDGWEETSSATKTRVIFPIQAVQPSVPL